MRHVNWKNICSSYSLGIWILMCIIKSLHFLSGVFCWWSLATCNNQKPSSRNETEVTFTHLCIDFSSMVIFVWVLKIKLKVGFWTRWEIHKEMLQTTLIIDLLDVPAVLLSLYRYSLWLWAAGHSVIRKLKNNRAKLNIIGFKRTKALFFNAWRKKSDKASS